MKTYFVLASVCAFSAACDDGGADPGGDAGAAGTNGGGMAGSGAGGAPAGAPTLMISDFETPSATDGVFDGHSEDATRGWLIDWFTYTDTADMKSPMGMIMPPEAARFIAKDDPSRAGNTHVGNIVGGNWKSWGAGMGFNFKNPVAAVNLSEFKGVSFWAKSTMPATYMLKVKIVDARNTPVARGGSCVAGMPVPALRCDDVPVYKAALNSEWKRFDAMWADFKPEGWGMTGYTNAQVDGVLSIQFQVGTDAAFDISVDSVGLLQ